MTMTRAIERIADTVTPPRRRVLVCHHCGQECAVSPHSRLDETACVACVERLASPCRDDGMDARAIRGVADWCDKAAAPGPGYGVVECPHCETRCVVEIGGTARTGCATCLRPLGTQPLLRMDLMWVDVPIDMDGEIDHFTDESIAYL